MCNTHDANTHEKLSRVYEQRANNPKAHEHMLEAASIYTLVAAQEKNTIMHQKANQCYQKAHQIMGTKKQELTIPELARATLHDLDLVNKAKADHLKAHANITPHQH